MVRGVNRVGGVHLEDINTGNSLALEKCGLYVRERRKTKTSPVADVRGLNGQSKDTHIRSSRAAVLQVLHVSLLQDEMDLFKRLSSAQTCQ